MGVRDTVVLVNDDGVDVGTCAKLAAHEPPGQLHLAFSVFLFSADARLLVQRRASGKYHFPGIWANTCCSHPAPGEEIVASAEQRVFEELGIGTVDALDALGAPDGGNLVVTGPLVRAGTFVYRAEDPVSGLVEHEYDHVLVGRISTSDGGPPGPGELPEPDPAEIEDLRWVAAEETRGLGAEAGFAPWYAQALDLALGASGLWVVS